MESDRRWMMQASTGNHMRDSCHFSSGCGDLQKQMRSITDSAASLVPRDHYQNFVPNNEMVNTVQKSVGNSGQERHGRSFSTGDDNLFIAETISNEALLSEVNSFADADSSIHTDVLKINGKTKQNKVEKQYHTFSVTDHSTSVYQSDDSELSEYDQEENAVHSKLGDASSCNICGDVVAGFHCGAYVCEACKKFFVRCLKQDVGSKFTCSQTNQCVITKETRTQCPHCRYQKCLKLGMYKPGGPNLSSEIRHIPCSVCGAPSSGFHFGAITCEGCKGFFRRSVKERDSLKYQCTRNGTCNITSKTRNVCKMCRYQQCLRAGMKPDKSRIGRQPNAIKHATFVQLNRIKLKKGLPVSDETLPLCETSNDTSDFNLNNHGLFIDDSDNFNVTSSSLGQHVKKTKTRKKKQNKDMSLLPQPCADNHISPDCSKPYLQVDVIKQESVSPLECNDSYPSYTSESENTCYPAEFVESDQNETNVCLSSQKDWSKIGLYEKDQATICRRYMPENFDYSAVKEVGRSKISNGANHGATANCSDTRVVTMAPQNDVPDQLRCSNRNSCDLESVISAMKLAYCDLEVVFSRAPSNKALDQYSSIQEAWDSQMAQFAHSAKAILKFSKKVPGFRDFVIEEQISVVQACMFPIVVVIMSLAYDVETRQICWFNFMPSEMKIIFDRFDPFCHLMQVMHSMGRLMHELNPDEVEVAFLCGIHLLDSGTQPFYKEQLIDALGEYLRHKLGGSGAELRTGRILMCLRNMAETNQQHLETVGLILSDPRYAHLEVPQLFKETFVGIDD